MPGAWPARAGREQLRGIAFGDTPLIGREEELDFLWRRWQQAKCGEGRVVLVSGEPGIGKSRLTAALSQQIDSEPHTRLRYFCSPHHQDSALHPFIGQPERAAGFARDDTPTMKLDKLEALLGDGAEPGDLSFIAEMLSLSGVERLPPLDLSPQRKKERTLAALLRPAGAVEATRAVARSHLVRLLIKGQFAPALRRSDQGQTRGNRLPRL